MGVLKMKLDLTIENLKYTLNEIQMHDPSSKSTFYPSFEASDQEYYNYRNELVYKAVIIARNTGYVAGFLIHTPVTDIIEKNWDHKWGVVAYIELPTGQVSWHIESPDIKYDGHTYVDKRNRIDEFIK